MIKNLINSLKCGFALAVLPVFFAGACAGNNDDIPADLRNDNNPDADVHYVSRDLALAKVRKRFANSRAQSLNLDVENYELYEAAADTRSDVASDVSARFHIFNFADNGGFAIVSADDRTTDIYAYATDGSLNMRDAMANTGFGLFMEGAVDYFDSEIASAANIDSLKNKLPPPISINPDLELQDWLYTDTVLYDVEYRTPLMTTTWSQDPPYNKYCFTKRGTLAATGCVPIAMAQIMAYHRFPISVNDHYLDWDVILADSMVHYTAACSDALAVLISEIGREAGAVYGETSTGVDPDRVVPVCKYFGYDICPRRTFSDSAVYLQLCDNKPVCTMGWGDGGAHTWVVDGCERQDLEVRYYDGCSPMPMRKEHTQRYYFHCNWGWGGYSNGYFLSNAFKSFDRRVAMFSDIMPADM